MKKKEIKKVMRDLEDRMTNELVLFGMKNNVGVEFGSLMYLGSALHVAYKTIGVAKVVEEGKFDKPAIEKMLKEAIEATFSDLDNEFDEETVCAIIEKSKEIDKDLL